MSEATSGRLLVIWLGGLLLLLSLRSDRRVSDEPHLEGKTNLQHPAPFPDERRESAEQHVVAPNVEETDAWDVNAGEEGAVKALKHKWDRQNVH